MREAGNFLKRNNRGVRSGCESFLNGCYQRAGLTLEAPRRGWELQWWDKESGNNERWRDQGEDERRRRRCSRRMRGSRREMKLALGTMLMRKLNQILSRPTIGPAGDLITSQRLLTRFTFTLLSYAFPCDVLPRHNIHPLSRCCVINMSLTDQRRMLGLNRDWMGR